MKTTPVSRNRSWGPAEDCACALVAINPTTAHVATARMTRLLTGFSFALVCWFPLAHGGAVRGTMPPDFSRGSGATSRVMYPSYRVAAATKCVGPARDDSVASRVRA